NRLLLEVVPRTERETLRTAADRDRVVVDAEVVGSLRVVGDLVVADPQARALRQRVRVADFVLVRAAIVASGQAADTRAGHGAVVATVRNRRALAFLRPRPVEVELTRADVPRQADAEHVARQLGLAGAGERRRSSRV